MNLTLKLKRDIEQPTEYCTMGILEVDGLARLQTIERPWVPGPEGSVCGHQLTSCIAKGLYRLDSRETEAKGKHWILSNAALGVYRYAVPEGEYGRALVLIHSANWAHELLGCIAPGLSRGYMENEWGVRSSRDAMIELRTRLAETPALSLEIT